MFGNSNHETNFPHKLLLTNRQVSNLSKAFANKSSTDIKLSKTQLSNIIQLGGFLGRLLRPLLKTGLPLMKNVIKELAKSVLIPLVWTAAASAEDAEIHKKVLGSAHHPSDSTSHDNTILIISNDEIEDVIKIAKSFEDSRILLKGVSETTQNEAKGEKGGFLSMLLGTLGPSLLGIILAGKGVIRAGDGAATKKQGKRTIVKSVSEETESKSQGVFNASSSFN